MDVPVDDTIACFIFERMLDLLVVLVLSLPLAAFAPGVMWILTFGFVATVVLIVLLLSRSSELWLSLARRAQKAKWDRLTRLFVFIGSGLAVALRSFRFREFVVSIAFGFAAWTVQSIGCVFLVAKLGMAIPHLAAFALYPFALLIGAASMLPGGIGTTEAAIVFLLHSLGAPLDRAALAAVGMRLSTLWFAILLGIIAAIILEFPDKRKGHSGNHD
jgi:uncharacterized protein (TIRG00374 family)